MAINGKVKGASGEREAISVLQPIVTTIYTGYGLEPPVLERNLEQTRGGGYDINGLPWLALEIKRVEVLALDKWWRQTTKQAAPDQVPCLMYRQNRKPWRYQIPMYDRDGRSYRCQLEHPEFVQWLAHQLADSMIHITAAKNGTSSDARPLYGTGMLAAIVGPTLAQKGP